jgi:hypothetical protein
VWKIQASAASRQNKEKAMTTRRHARHAMMFMAKKGQEGVIMIVSLVMLVAITMLVLGMVNISSNQFLTISNYQLQKEAEGAARQGIEQFLNSQTGFTNVIDSTALSVNYFGAPSSGTYTSVSNIRGHSVKITVPYCYGAKTAPGYSAISNIAPEDTHWTITSVATNAATGAKVTVQEGIKIRLASGNCGTPQ